MTNEELREIERQSIRKFLSDNASCFKGDVLDYGCGKQPYRELVEAAGGKYTPYDLKRFPANVSGEDVGPSMPWRDWDCIISTQVLQYVPHPAMVMRRFFDSLVRREGFLVLTYPTTWPVVEREDMWRFTLNGMHELAKMVGFRSFRGEVREWIDMGSFKLPIGGGLVAQAR